MTEHHPLPKKEGEYYGSDFNRLGKMLEERGLVGITAIGSAIVRLFRMQDLIELAKVEAKKDHNVFRARQGGKITPLKDGQIVLSPVQAACYVMNGMWLILREYFHLPDKRT